MPKIDVYGWQGVNTTKSAIQLEDNELSKAQNAFRDSAGEHGALRKRPGLTKINSVALSGEILGFVNVPLNPVTTRRFLIGADQTAPPPAYTWFTSVDAFGSVTTTTTPAAMPQRALSEATFFGTVGSTMLNKAIQTENLFLYPSDHTNGAMWAIRAWDGTVDRELFVIPPNPLAVANYGSAYNPTTPPASPTYSSQISQMHISGSKLYIAIADYVRGTNPAYSRIMEYDFQTRVIRQIGEGAGSGSTDLGDGAVLFRSVTTFQGYVYAGIGCYTTALNSTDAGIWKILPGVETAWTRELSLDSAPNGEVPICFAEYRGQLYAGLQDYDSASQRLLVRSTTGTWSASTTVGTAVQSSWLALKVFGDNLYATSFDENGGSDVTRVHRFNGSAWSVVKTIETAANARMGVEMVVHNDRLYVLAINNAGAGLVTHTADGTAWTDISSGLTADVSSVFGVLAT